MPLHSGKLAALIGEFRRLPLLASFSVAGMTVIFLYYLVQGAMHIGAAKAIVNGFADQTQIDSIKEDVGKIERSIKSFQDDVKDALRQLRDEVGAIRKESQSITEHVSVIQARFEDHINFTIGDGGNTGRQVAVPAKVKKRTPTPAGWKAETVQSSASSLFRGRPQ